MSYQLVIAEKPSVARSIAGVIGANKKQDGYMEGNGYLVSWCIGHLVSLADAGAYDPRYRENSFSVSSIRWRAAKSRSSGCGFPAWRTPLSKRALPT